MEARNTGIQHHSEAELHQIGRYRQRLLFMMLLSSGSDLALSLAGAAIAIPTFGGSVLLEEVVEYLISILVAGTRLRLKKRYKIIGFLPVPGVTALSAQCLFELWRVNKRPDEVLRQLAGS